MSIGHKNGTGKHANKTVNGILHNGETDTHEGEDDANNFVTE